MGCDGYNLPMSDLPACFALFGQPVAHSLSPRIHATFAEQLGVALEYTAVEVAPEEFAAEVGRFVRWGGRGLNITVPHKAAAAAVAAEASAAVQRSGVANTLSVRDNGSLRADNTDGVGLVRDLLARQKIVLRNSKLLLLGAGGAARGVAPALLDAGIGKLLVANRTLTRAEALVAALDDPRASATEWSGLHQTAPFDLILHATAAGVQGKALALPSGVFRDAPLCYDLSYGAGARAFLEAARAAGVERTCDGLGMLIEQAAESFAIWHGVRPQTEPVYAMLRAAA